MQGVSSQPELRHSPQTASYNLISPAGSHPATSRHSFFRLCNSFALLLYFLSFFAVFTMTTITSSLSSSRFPDPFPTVYNGTPEWVIQRPSLAVADLGYSFDYSNCKGDHMVEASGSNERRQVVGRTIADASTCQDACGTTYEQCWHITDNLGIPRNTTGCYNPSMGEVCCGM